MEIIGYLFIIAALVTVVYGACRWIHYIFTTKEMTYDAMCTSYHIKEVGDEIEWLTDDMLKKVNDAAQKMFKSFTGDNEAES